VIGVTELIFHDNRQGFLVGFLLFGLVHFQNRDSVVINTAGWACKTA